MFFFVWREEEKKFDSRISVGHCRAIREYFLLYRIESSWWSPRNSPVHTCGLRKRAYRAGNHDAKAACLERLSSGTAD